MTIDRLEGGPVPSPYPSAACGGGGMERENEGGSGRAAAVAGDATPGAAIPLYMDRPPPAPAARVCGKSSSCYNGSIAPDPRGGGQRMMMRQLLIILFRSGQRGRRNPTTRAYVGFRSRARRKMSFIIFRRKQAQLLLTTVDAAATAAGAAGATAAADGNLFLPLIVVQHGGSIGDTACRIDVARAVNVRV